MFWIEMHAPLAARRAFLVLRLAIAAVSLAACGVIIPSGPAPTALPAPATLTSPPPAAPTATFTPVIVVAEPTASPTAEVMVEAQATPTPVPTRPPSFRFELQPGGIRLVPNFFRPEVGCNWLGIAGQAFDINSQPLTKLVVEAGGSLLDKPVLGIGVTGNAQMYGPGGYEIQLNTFPAISRGTVYVVLYDLQGKQLTDRIYFDTSDRCDQNLVVINFVETARIPIKIYFPVLR
jgi:hypothetical protein